MNIKNHEIIHEISRGALTTVYKARHLNLDRPVILKVLNKQWLKQKDLLARFRREAQISARLKHPNIVNVYDFEISTELVYISLEYVEGQNLDQYVKKNHPIKLDVFFNIAKNILSALKYAHEHGVIHRDIKPANILIDANFQARLTDFGLASLHDIPSLTEQGQSMGTPAYMAPEQIQGESASIQTDIYSLGITFYEILTAKSPYQKDNTAATLQSVLVDALPEITDFRSDIPEWLNAILKQLTAKEKAERIKNIAAIQDLFAEQLTEFKIEKNPATPVLNKKLLPVFAILVFMIFALYIMRDPDPKTIDNAVFEPQQLVNMDSSVNKKSVDSVKAFNEQKLETDSASDVLQMEKKSPVNNAKTDSGNINAEISLPAFGELFIECKPWAKVIIDNDTISTIHLKSKISLAAGNHFLELYNPYYKSVKKEIVIRAGQLDTLIVELQAEYGYLSVDVFPWAKLFINNTYKEDTPLDKPILVQSGKNVIKLVNPSLGEITDTVYIEASKKLEKKYIFKN